MRSFVGSIGIVALFALAGCQLFFDDRGGKSPCETADDIADPPPGAQPAPQRNPETLECQSFGSTCDPSCGPCPETAFAPIPSWGSCGSFCEGQDEAGCAASPECRVVKDARCAVSGDCTTDFLGCFPTDSFTDPTTDCFAARDGQTCSRSSACTALHRLEPCPLALDAPCPEPFAMCVPEGQSPGQCFAPVTCDAVGPACPKDSTPGIENGCFTGACIPMDLCGPVALQ